MEEMEKEPAPTEQSAGNAAAAEQLTSAAEESQPKEDTEKIPEPTDIAEDKEKTEDAERPTHIEKDSSPPEQDLAKEVDDLVPGSAENSAEERDLLGHSAEERELQARDVSFGSETFDEDFLIMDEVQGDDDEESLTKATESTPPGSMENLSTSAGADEDSSKAGEKSDTEKTEETTEKAKDTEMQESAEAMPMQEATEDTPAQHATEATPAQHATEGATAQEATEVTAAQAAAEDTPVQEAGEVQAEDDDDDVVIEELQPPPPSEPVVISMTDDEEEEVPPQGDAQMEDAKGNVATEASVEATGPEKFDRETTEEGVDEDSLATENSDLGKARETSAQDADNESTQSSKEVPVANGSDESREDKSLGEKAAAECNGTASLLKRPLSPDAWKGGDSEATKKVKCEVVTAGTVETGGAGDKKFVVMTRGELEKYVNMRVQESLAKQEQTMLQPMEKKCDTLHRALERWRRRSFQLQKQLNEFVCEQEKCAGARKGRVTQRSVGVCVRMPPLRSAPPPAPVVRTNVVTSGSIVSSSPASASPAQVARANINASTVVTRGPTAPTVRVLTVPPPAAAVSTALSRLSTQTTSGTSAPVPLQLIANTSSPTSQVKSVSLPCTTGSSTVVRTVAMVPSSTAVVTTSAGVKVIDLTQEEDANLARLVAVSSAAGGTVQKITVPSSAIPMLSAAPTTLVQVSPALSRNTTTTQVVGTPNTPTSTGAIRISHPVMTPQRVTYLLPNLSPNVVMNQREGAPRLASSTVSMPTILLRMTTPPNNLVPGSTISMSSLTTQPGSGGNLMVAPPGTQVRMIRAPTPVALQKGGNTFTLPPGTTVVRAPVTIPSAMGTTVVTTKADQSLPPTPRVVVSGTVPPAADASLAKHPAPLPPMPRYLDDPKKKRLPPKPALKITKAASGIVLSWNMTLNSLYADIQTYQLYAYQETSNAPSSTQWKKVGDVRALPLPMACTLTQFVEGHKYHFAVRAVDMHNRLGPFSEPSSILLK